MSLTESSRKGSALAQFRQVYCWQLKKNRILSIVYGAMTLLCFTMVYLSRSISLYQNYFKSEQDWTGMTQQQILNSLSQDMASNLNQQFYLVLIPLSLLFLVVFSVTAFGYMHRRRSVDLFHALPIRRTPMLLGNLAAGFTTLALVTVLNTLLCGIIAFAMGVVAPFTFLWLLEGVGYLLLLLAAAMALTLFLLVASGTMVNAVLSGIFLSLSWPALCYCGAVIIRMTLPGSALNTSSTVATALVPYLAVFVPFLDYAPVEAISSKVLGAGNYTEEYNGMLGNYYEISPLTVVWWCAVTILLLAAAVLVYRKRKSECAENNFSFPGLRSVIRFLVSAAFGLGCGVVFGAILNRNWVFFLAVIVGAALAHSVTQVIWVKGLREFKKSLPAYGVLVVSMCVFFVGLCTDGLGYVTRVPTPASVESIRLQMPGYHYDDSAQTYLGESAQQMLDNETGEFSADVSPRLEAKTSVKTVEELHQALINRHSVPYLPCHQQEYNSCTITYQLDNGKEMERVYELPESDWEETKTEEDSCDAEILKKLAAVVALDEYQACSLYYYQTRDQVDSVRSDWSRKRKHGRRAV